MTVKIKKSSRIFPCKVIPKTKSVIRFYVSIVIWKSIFYYLEFSFLCIIIFFMHFSFASPLYYCCSCWRYLRIGNNILRKFHVQYSSFYIFFKTSGILKKTCNIVTIFRKSLHVQLNLFCVKKRKEKLYGTEHYNWVLYSPYRIIIFYFIFLVNKHWITFISNC